jgi:hypothetical protein
MKGVCRTLSLVSLQTKYTNTTITLRKDRISGNIPVEINKRIGQGCPLSLFNIFVDRRF